MIILIGIVVFFYAIILCKKIFNKRVYSIYSIKKIKIENVDMFENGED